ncbi:MAG: amidohydrolase [Tepidanaerobacteraceae bacterium]|nr:amidohydrolase [Tepidanaerobacteraceae bacterium]
MSIRKEVKELIDEAIELRRDFHRHPELGFKEFRTSAIIEKYLKDLGLEVRRIAKTGIVGILEGSMTGKTVMFRADMDALPIQEETGLPFQSENKGVMHACGHDGHTAMLLIAAKILSQHKSQIKGKIKFVFQPNEEDAGAQIMIDEGVLQNPKVDAAIGLHLWSPIPTAKIGIVSGPIMASSYYFKLTIKGRGGHGGAPHKAINPLNPAVDIIHGIKTMQAEEFDAMKPTLITIGKIEYGTKAIIIPDMLTMEGSIRCLHNNEKQVHERFKELVAGICINHRTDFDLELKCGNSLLKNDPTLTKLVMETAEKILGEGNILTEDVSVMLGDDFAEFGNEVPVVYYFVGTADIEKGTHYEHHNASFNIDEDSLPIGIEMHVKTALAYLNSI